MAKVDSIYQRIKKDIIASIQDKQYTPGQCLPSERDLCIQYNASRMTVRMAINELRSEGIVYKIQGKGTFVSVQNIEKNLARLTSFSYDMYMRGKRPGSTGVTIRVVPCEPKVASRLQLTSGSPIAIIQRVRTADDEPIALQRSYISLKDFPGIDQMDFCKSSLYEILTQKYNAKPVKAIQSLEVIMIQGDDAAKLCVPNMAVGLYMKRETYSLDNKPVEYVESIYRGDAYVFYFELNC